MSNPIEKISEYVKLGAAIDGINIELNKLKDQIELTNDLSQFQENLIGLSFLARKEIMNRIDEYDWSFEGPIRVASIYNSNITLLEALNTILDKLKNLSDLFNEDMQEIIFDILDQGNYYYQILRAQENQ
jgi:hypothetical protein